MSEFYDFGDDELMVWTLTEEGARHFFGAPFGTPVRVVKDRPETAQEIEKYAPDAKLFAVKNWRKSH